MGLGKNGVSWSTDGGTTWHSYIPADDPAIAVDFRAWDFAFDGQTVWVAGTTGGRDALLRTDDGGTTWRLVPFVTVAGDSSRGESGISDVAFNNGVLWAATEHGLARSTDRGERWTYVLRYPQADPLGGGAPLQAGPEADLTTYAFPVAVRAATRHERADRIRPRRRGERDDRDLGCRRR